MERDHEIWEKLRQGDKSALSFIYFNYFKSMYQYGMKFRQDPDFIKDCIQDVFFKMIEMGEKIGPTDNIRFYLFKTLKNTIFKKAEKENRKKTLEIPVVFFNATFLIDDELSENEERQTNENALQKALSKLTDKQREIIYLRFECEMKYEQICEIMQLKNESARKLLFRAISSLRDAISKQNETKSAGKSKTTNKVLFNIPFGCPQNQRKRI